MLRMEDDDGDDARVPLNARPRCLSLDNHPLP